MSQISSQPQADAAPRRGRPPRLSREQILEAVAEMLRGDPRSPLTMARAAEAVGASPMSLYRYFADRDDLVMSVTRYVLRDADDGVPDAAPWDDRVRAWMRTVYQRAVTHPQLFQLAASGESPAWLTCSARLAEILETAGFVDDAQVASAILWIGTTTLGQAMVAAASEEELSSPRLFSAIGHLTPEEVRRVEPLIPHFAAIGAAGFDIVVDFTIAALAASLEGGRGRRRR
jgi:TetR/AcrR family tetracycline transcriptional repressor